MTDPLAFVAHVWLVLVIVPLTAGVLWGALVTLVGLHYLARAVRWWDSETPDARAARAIVACFRVPPDQRRHFVKGLRAIWGEGPFRTVP